MLEKGNVYYDNLEAFSKNLQEGLKEIFPDVFHKKERVLKESILKASNQYIFEENTSLWSQTWFKDAYIAYFINTQTSRLFYTFNRIKDTLDFNNISNTIDFGCGPASAHLAASAVFKSGLNKSKWLNIDSSKEALKIAKEVENYFKLNSSYTLSDKIPEPKSENDLLILSFALCEGLNTENIFKYKYVLLLEPGQFSNSKNLIALRQKALDTGFNALAPCVHQGLCPMREGAKNWCHDTAPKPKSMPQYNLPFSGDRLNFSYLLLAKGQASLANSADARIIGDLRPEKGKSKIALCIDESPVFLSWLKKSKLDLNLNRGDLIEMPEQAETKGQEVRIETEISLKNNI
ncbi:MAG: small ribosomal subunit Rsm22 family protein [Bdellovibrionales bacterium]